MEPQLAMAVQPEKLHRYAHYSMEPKLDGIRCIAYKDNRGKVSLTSRGGKDLTLKVPHVVSWLEDILQGDWVYLDGELGYQSTGSCLAPALNFNLTTRALGSSVSVALDKQATTDGQIQYFVFDCPLYPTSGQADWRHEKGQPDKNRRHHLESIMVDDEYVSGDPVVLVPRMPRYDGVWYDRYVLEGGEGVMLKNPDALYDPGGRHANNWYKVKKFDTTDGLIVDVKEGLGKYQGMCGAIQVLTDDEVLFWCAGMTDEQRVEFWFVRKEIIGQRVEVKHFGLTAGTPRFPQFLRLRLDI